LNTPTFNAPPQRVCLLRLSAIGDTCHALAALRTMQAAWPQTRFTWIIGKLEAKLMTALLPEVEFITFDKSAMLKELRRLRAVLLDRRFDLLLDLQLSIRASLISTLVRAPVKLGFDRRRAREMQWLFTNAQIAATGNEHVLDSFMRFPQACGIRTPAVPHWNPPLPADAQAYASAIVAAVPGAPARLTLLISPCSSHTQRNWRPQRYAAVADHAINTHQMRVVLVGGRSSLEMRMGEQIIAAANTPLLNQIGKDTLPQLLGLMAASSVLLSPDSGPAHMATMVGLPVVGLYAATRTARAGPYLSRAWCVDEYEAAALKFYGKPAGQVAWTLKIEKPGVMDLISVESVIAKLDALLATLKLAKMPP
jgi:heptosyltransferase I